MLVVDDNADMRDYAQRLLRRYWKVETAANGELALERIRASAPDLILCDVMMPVMDGFQLIRILRAEDGTRFIPVILLSARAGEEATSEGLQSGADDYLVKPFSARELISRVDAQLKTSQARKTAENRIREANRQTELQRARLHALFQEAPAGICILEGPGLIFRFANPNYLTLAGRQDILGKSLKEVFPELADQGIPEILAQVYRTGETFTIAELPLLLDRGRGMEECHFTLTYQAMRGLEDVIEGILVFAYDVTTQVNARKRSEVAAERILAQKQVFEALATGERLQEILSELARICEKHFPGTRASILLADPEGKRLTTGAAPSLPEAYSRAIDGIPIAVGSGSCGTAAFTGQDTVSVDLTADPNWRDFRWLAREHELKSCWSFPMLSSKGSLLGTFELYFRDSRAPTAEESTYLDIWRRNAAVVIERKYAEEALRRTETQLQHSQKMDALGKMAGGIAHEFNNLLTAINGYTELLCALPEDAPDRSSYLEEIRKAGARAAGLTRQILAFGRKQILAPKSIDLNQVVEGMLRMMRQIIGENIRLDFRASAAPAFIMADPGQLEQVILNLAINARDAMPDGGKLAIRSSGLELRRSESGIPDGKYILLAIADTGVGMDEKTLERIFEPFFTTKAIGKGTGLGLSMVEGIVRQSGGYITVKSELGKGTEFMIYMPSVRAGHPPPKPVANPGAEPATRGSGTILLVEDEEAVRKMVSHSLAARGYRLFEAESGEAALSLHYAHENEDIDILLTDIMMPGINGRQLAERMVEMRPSLKIVYMSGYIEDEALRNSLRSQDRFLPKPFSPSTLIKSIQEVIAGVYER